VTASSLRTHANDKESDGARAGTIIAPRGLGLTAVNPSKNHNTNFPIKAGSEVKKTARVIAGLPSLAIVISFAACAQTVAGPSSIPTSSGVAAAIAEGTQWKLQSLTRADSTVTRVSEPNRFTLTFNDGNKITVRADCNNAFGGFTANGNSISVGPMASTKAYCSTAPFDDEYLTAINGESTIAATATTLVMSSSRGRLLFTN